jgi:hypothetical protein
VPSHRFADNDQIVYLRGHPVGECAVTPGGLRKSLHPPGSRDEAAPLRRHPRHPSETFIRPPIGSPAQRARNGDGGVSIRDVSARRKAKRERRRAPLRRAAARHIERWAGFWRTRYEKLAYETVRGRLTPGETSSNLRRACPVHVVSCNFTGRLSRLQLWSAFDEGPKHSEQRQNFNFPFVSVEL